MRRALRFITGREWAVVVAVVTAILAELPAVAEAVQGELASDKWSPVGLLIVVAGFVIRSKVWSAVSNDEIETELGHAVAETAKATQSVVEKDTQLRALRLLVQAQQRGEVTQFKRDPLPGRVGDPVTFVDQDGYATGGLNPGLGHPGA